MCYTFFAPTSSAFLRTLPQDIGDPFFNDAEFRLKMLLRHFSPTCVTKEELKKMTTLTMADSKSVKITQEEGNNIFLKYKCVVIYIRSALKIQEAARLTKETSYQKPSSSMMGLVISS